MITRFQSKFQAWFWRRSLGLATGFVRFVQGLALMLVVDLVDVQQSICFYWCLLSTLDVFAKAWSYLLTWNQGTCSSTMCMMYLHSADPVEPTYRWSIHCVISFTTTTKWTSQVGDDLMEQELIHVSLRSKNSCLGSFDGAEWRFGILLETSFHVREVVYV